MYREQRTPSRRDFFLVPPLLLVANWVSGAQRADPPSAEVRAAIRYLSNVMDQYHRTADVYTDSHAAGNHFPVRERMSSPGGDNAAPPMNERSTIQPHSGATCIEATFRARDSNWAGWYFLNGVLDGRDVIPRANWGAEPLAGLDLRGASKLEWWARGSRGNERVEFLAFGVGRDASGNPTAPYPDSSPKVRRIVTLTREWQRFEIDLGNSDSGKVDLRYVLGGFGWTAGAQDNGNRDITFYIDDVKYLKPRLDEPRFLVSYETERSGDMFDTVMRNVAYTYDNAVSLIALLAAGERDRARLIAEAFIYAQRHDPAYKDRRLRNAYQGGTLIAPPGWTPGGTPETVRLPGWPDPNGTKWLEDSQQIGSNTGNLAWAILSLTAYAEQTGDDRALTAAVDLGNWIENSCRDTRGAGGYRAGFERWPDDLLTLEYKATEHSIDLYAAFRRLLRLTKREEWRGRAEHARRFVLSMWDEKEGKFWTGTGTDGVTPATDVVPLDVQVWALLALGSEGAKYRRALEYVEAHLRVGRGYDFNQDGDGIWYEGTAQAAAAYHYVGDAAQRTAILRTLAAAQLPSGALYAANRDGLTTGFNLPDGRPWLYYRRPAIAGTAWMAIAALGVNPFE